MDKPSQTLAQQITEQCPNCRSQTLPVVTETTTPTLLTAAYRCVMCRTDFTSVWQQGYVRQNQPQLPFDAATSDIMPAAQPTDLDNIVGNRATTAPSPSHLNAPDGVCQSCLAKPGTPHALACPYA